MTWAATVRLDEDKSDVGLASVVFTDVDATQFTYTERQRLTIANRDAFIGRAIAARNAWRTRKTSENNLANNLQTAIIAADI